MSISVSFYNNLSDNRYLTKNLTSLAENITCDVYAPCDRLNPILLIDKDTIPNCLSLCNYCVIPEFSRKYFITNITGVSGNRLQLTCHVDVLSTYDSELRECPIIAARSSNKPNYYLDDEMRIFDTRVINQYINIGPDVGPPSDVILITV